MKTYKITAEISVPFVNTYEVNANTLREAQRKIKSEMKKRIVTIPIMDEMMEVGKEWEDFLPVYDMSLKKNMRFHVQNFLTE